VCLAVMGKYLPSLQFFATLLGEETELDVDVRLYQRLVSLDRDGAIALIEEEITRRTRVEIFDQILVPALSRAERDASRDELGEKEQAFVWRVVGEALDNLELVPDSTFAASSPQNNGKNGAAHAPIRIVGLAVQDTSDSLVLRMLGQLVGPSDCELEVINDVESPLAVAERLAEISPAMVILSHLPPEGLTQARYLVRRIRARFSELSLLVGRWGETGGTAAAAERLVAVGATKVVFTLADARDTILAAVGRENPTATLPSKATAALPA
jgi:hypothetical protein